MISYFVGGVLDGKELYVPDFYDEWKVALSPGINLHRITEEVLHLIASQKLHLTYHVYKKVLDGLFWLSRIEKDEKD